MAGQPPARLRTPCGCRVRYVGNRPNKAGQGAQNRAAGSRRSASTGIGSARGRMQGVDNGLVGREKGQLPRLFRREPAQQLPVLWQRFPGKFNHVHKMKHNAEIRIVMAEALPHQYGHAKNIQFFPQFTHKGFADALPRLLLAAREFPIPCPGFSFRSFGRKETPVFPDDAGSDLNRLHDDEPATPYAVPPGRVM